MSEALRTFPEYVERYARKTSYFIRGSQGTRNGKGISVNERRKSC